jgi:4,5-DOPA dioxygenase extradiol
MNRSDFIKLLSFASFSGMSMQLQELKAFGDAQSASPLMPALFLGHGSPMNALELNEFSQSWQKLGKDLPRPSAIVCLSAHWETKGTKVTALEKPATIHDFGGFPQALFDVQYPAPGSPTVAKEIVSLVQHTQVSLDYEWGLDHGTWSVLKHLYPLADIPVLQISLDYTQSPLWHYQLAQDLKALRRKGVLILGSGNIVHNLGMIAWDKVNAPEYGYDWALEISATFKKLIQSRDIASLANYQNLGKAASLAVPTPEHFLPLLYILGVLEKDEPFRFFNDKALMGSLTMTSILSLPEN